MKKAVGGKARKTATRTRIIKDRPKARPNSYQGFDAGKFLGEQVDNFNRGVGVVAKGIGDLVGGIPNAINTGRNAIMGGQESTVRRAMTKK